MIAHDPNLELRLAHGEQDRRGADRLRYQVFVKELGGDGDLVDHHRQEERDQFDPHAEQLILVDRRRDAAALDHVVGAYRMLDAKGAARAGQFYSESEYDLSVLRNSGRTLLELGRSCLHRDYRKGAALFMLWNGLADHINRRGYELLFGVASFRGTDPSVYQPHLSYLYNHHLSPDALRVRARPARYLAMDTMAQSDIIRADVMRTMPPLIKAYLRIGGYVGDGAFVDQAFNTTDVFMVLDTSRMAPRTQARYAAVGAT